MFWVGTSGYNYPEWKGSFYPDDLPAKKMLPYYAARFPTVEINYTFYRMPTEKLVAGWAEQTPAGLRRASQLETVRIGRWLMFCASWRSRADDRVRAG